MKNKTTNSADNTERKTYKKFENVVTMMRREVRYKLLQFPPQWYHPLSSLSCNLLDAQLTDIKYIAEENYKNYKQSYIASGQFSCKIRKPFSSQKMSMKNHKKLRRNLKMKLQMK